MDARRGSSRLVQIVNPVIERDRQRSPPPRHLSPGDRGTIARDRRPAAAAGLRAVQCTVKRRSSDREAVGHARSGRRQRSVSVARVLPEKTMKIYYPSGARRRCAQNDDLIRRSGVITLHPCTRRQHTVSKLQYCRVRFEKSSETEWPEEVSCLL